MRVVIFCHSLLSDWNHGNAHFLRGIAAELLAAGHDVRVFEPATAWSMANLLQEAGPGAIAGFHAAYPELRSTRYDEARLDLDQALDGADVVLVHEWNGHPLVQRIGRHRSRTGRYILLFHDTHHRSITDEAAMGSYDLQHYDGVLAFGEVIRERYLRNGWARRAWTWHEAADVRRFRPLRDRSSKGTGDPGMAGDIVWIGNWGDEERSAEIHQYLIGPAAAAGLRARVHGVRYPDDARKALDEAGIEYGSWLPNYRVPEVFARYRVTLHIPRRPYVEALPGVPTIRVFEALACGIPLVSCWWSDCEGLFKEGEDFLMVRSPGQMRAALQSITKDAALAAELSANGRRTILARHTCAHRVAELSAIVASLRGRPIERAMTA